MILVYISQSIMSSILVNECKSRHENASDCVGKGYRHTLDSERLRDVKSPDSQNSTVAVKPRLRVNDFAPGCLPNVFFHRGLGWRPITGSVGHLGNGCLQALDKLPDASSIDHVWVIATQGWEGKI